MASVNWKSAASGGRTVASNWDSGNVPGTSDDVFISVAGSHTVSLIAAITVASITIGDASAVPQIQNPGGDDVVTGNLDGGGSVGVDAIGAGGSTLTIGGTLTDGNAIQVGNGGMTTSDLLTVGGTVTGTFAVNAVITGTGVVAGTQITAAIGGVGGTGTYVVSTGTGVGSGAINANGNIETKWSAASAGGVGALVKMTSWVGSQG